MTTSSPQRTFLIAVAAFFSVHAHAEEPVQLETLVQQVVQTNPELDFYEQEVASAKGEFLEASAWVNPELEATVGRKEQSEDEGLSREGTAWSVSVMQSFEYPGRVSLRKAIANGQIRLAELGLKRFKTALAGKARLLGFELRAKQELADASRRVSGRAQELIGVLVQRESGGVAPLLETRIIESSLLGLRKEALNAEKEAQASLFALNLLRGKELNSPIIIAPADIKLPILPDVETLLASAAKNNFDLKMQQVELENQGFKVALSKHERWPSVSVGPFYEEESPEEKTLGVSLSLPLPVWNRNAGKTAANEARETQARASLIVAQRKVEHEVREKALAYKLLISEMAKWSAGTTKELSDAAALGDKHYRLGAIPVNTYVELQERYLSGLASINETRAQALEAVQDLELLTGENFLRVKELGEVKK